jgi:hypothetical protein
MNMDFEMQPYGVFIKVDDDGRITDINSDAFLTDTHGWIPLDSGFSDKYHHAQGNYLPKSIMDERGIYRYKFEDGKPVERTQEEMDADYNPPAPAPESTDSARITALEQTLAAYEAAYREGVEDV